MQDTFQSREDYHAGTTPEAAETTATPRTAAQAAHGTTSSREAAEAAERGRQLKACPELVERACPELVERACPELVEGLSSTETLA